MVIQIPVCFEVDLCKVPWSFLCFETFNVSRSMRLLDGSITFSALEIQKYSSWRKYQLRESIGRVEDPRNHFIVIKHLIIVK
jgi:hypothetical protein